MQIQSYFHECLQVFTNSRIMPRKRKRPQSMVRKAALKRAKRNAETPEEREIRRASNRAGKARRHLQMNFGRTMANTKVTHPTSYLFNLQTSSRLNAGAATWSRLWEGSKSSSVKTHDLIFFLLACPLILSSYSLPFAFI